MEIVLPYQATDCMKYVLFKKKKKNGKKLQEKREREMVAGLFIHLYLNLKQNCLNHIYASTIHIFCIVHQKLKIPL